MQIRELAPDEWPLFKEIRLKSLQTDPKAFGATYDSTVVKTDAYWRERLEIAAGRNQSWMLFADDGNLIGMVGGYRKDDSLVELISMYVAPERRGEGVGRRLVESVLAAVKEAGFSRMFLYVNEAQDAAIGLYQRCGFDEVPSDWEGTRRFEQEL